MAAVSSTAAPKSLQQKRKEPEPEVMEDYASESDDEYGQGYDAMDAHRKAFFAEQEREKQDNEDSVDGDFDPLAAAWEEAYDESVVYDNDGNVVRAVKTKSAPSAATAPAAAPTVIPVPVPVPRPPPAAAAAAEAPAYNPFEAENYRHDVVSKFQPGDLLELGNEVERFRCSLPLDPSKVTKAQIHMTTRCLRILESLAFYVDDLVDARRARLDKQKENRAAKKEQDAAKQEPRATKKAKKSAK